MSDDGGYVLHGKQFGAPHEVEADTLEEALGAAWAAIEFNHMGPEYITHGGEVVADRDAIDRYCDERDRREADRRRDGR
jgi:hypothetical protein